MNYTQYHGRNPFGTQAKLLSYTDRIERWRDGFTYPVFCEVNLTSRCQLRCQWCINANTRGHDDLEPEVAKMFFRDFKYFGGEALTFSGGGEPTMHPQFEELLIDACQHVPVGLMTNGVFGEPLAYLLKYKLAWVRVSLDTIDPKEYERWKGIDHTRTVLRTIRALKGGRAKVGVNVNVGMEHTLPSILRLIGTVEPFVDYLQFRPILPRMWAGEAPEVNQAVFDYLRPMYRKNPRFSFSDDKLDDLAHDQVPFRRCEGHWFSPVVHADGCLYPCMYHLGNEAFRMGRLENGFETVWQSEKAKDVREHVAGLDYARDCQRCCKLWEQNKVLDWLAHPEDIVDRSFL